MGITRLQLYNKALLACGERFLSALTESNEPRRLLDHVWDTDGVEYALEQAPWYFAMRTTKVEYDSSITPGLGYRYGFSKPDDYVLLDAVCSDEYFNEPLTRYADEMGYWFADIEPIYVKFVSKADTYGKDLSLWTASFADYAGNLFASRIIGKLGGDKSEQRKALFGPPGFPDRGALAMSLSKAKSLSAKTQPTLRPAEGAWVRSRRGGRGYRNDRGNPGSLIG